MDTIRYIIILIGDGFYRYLELVRLQPSYIIEKDRLRAKFSFGSSLAFVFDEMD